MQIKLVSILILLSLATLNAQHHLHEILLKASQFYSSEKYLESITECKRVIYFDSEKLFHSTAYEIMGDSYKEAGFFSEAVQAYNLAETCSFNEEVIFNLKLKKIKINILRRTTSNAHRLLNELDSTFHNSKDDEIFYWRGWTYIFEDDWKSASIEFAKIDSLHELKNFCEKVDNEKYSVTFAKTISAILPGSGQIYSGHYLNGLVSLGWNVLWGYLSIKAFKADRIFDGMMISSLLWLRFYNGNVSNSEKFVAEKNQEITNNALYYLQNQYKGMKP